MRNSTKLTPRDNPPATTLSNEVLDAAGQNQDDDGMTKIRHAALDEAFNWSIRRFSQTYHDLA